MPGRKNIYIYPTTPLVYQHGSNDYIKKVRACLSRDFYVVNKSTTRGMFDLLAKLPKTDIFYFNWIEDVVDKRFGYVQIVVLFFILIACKLSGKQIVWFVHNNSSHYNQNKAAKKFIYWLMKTFADTVLTHSKEASIFKQLKEVQVFDHPVDPFQPVDTNNTSYDVLIWGAINHYKGVKEFVEHYAADKQLHDVKVLIAGKFSSDELYTQVKASAPQNITIHNRVLDEEELRTLFKKSKCVLFNYNSSSVLSSGALCKTLSYGKTIIGPERGSFKELGAKGLIYTYSDFYSLSLLLQGLKRDELTVDQHYIQQYVQDHSWENFTAFLLEHLDCERGELAAAASV